jgi:hypothetical protein
MTSIMNLLHPPPAFAWPAIARKYLQPHVARPLRPHLHLAPLLKGHLPPPAPAPAHPLDLNRDEAWTQATLKLRLAGPTLNLKDVQRCLLWLQEHGYGEQADHYNAYLQALATHPPSPYLLYSTVCLIRRGGGHLLGPEHLAFARDQALALLPALDQHPAAQLACFFMGTAHEEQFSKYLGAVQPAFDFGSHRI